MGKLFNAAHYMGRTELAEVQAKFRRQLVELYGPLRPAMAPLEAKIRTLEGELDGAKRVGEAADAGTLAALSDAKDQLTRVVAPVRVKAAELQEAIGEVSTRLAQANVCVICGAPAAKVQHNRPYCADETHNHYTRPQA